MVETYNFRPVNELLATAGLPTAEQLHSAAANGFEVVINLAVDNNPPYSLADEAEIVRSLGLTYIHIPVKFSEPTEQDLLQFCDAMDAHAAQRKFVHCAANKRVSVFIGLYRVIRLGWDPEPAFDLVRSLWQPDPVWRGFIDQMLAKR